MKKMISLILLLGLVLSLSACSEVEITMQEIIDANQTEALLQNHESVYIWDDLDGNLFSEVYLTKDYFYMYLPSDEADWLEFIADDEGYCCVGDDCVYYVFITPDGLSNFASERAERSTSIVLGAEALDYTVESISEKDGRITVKAFMGQEILAAETEEFGVTSAKFEYMLDAKTHEMISITSDSTYNDDTSYHVITNVNYDADVPEKLLSILAFQNQTEDLRNITIVSNPGTEKEETKCIQVPKGLIFGFEFDDTVADAVEFYTDAACTQSYDPYADTDSDLTVYVKWAE